MSITDTRIHILKLIELSVAVFRGPDADTWAKIATVGVPELAAAVKQKSLAAPAPVELLTQSLTSVEGQEEGYAVLESEFVRLFLAGRGGVPAPLYESCHQGGEARTMGRSALEMHARLDQAGLAVALSSNEPPDHLAIELEYLYHLLATGWQDDPALVEIATEFARDTMLPWVTRFYEALTKTDPHPVFLHTTEIALSALENVVADFDHSMLS